MYQRSPTRKLYFDVKIMSTMIPQNHKVSLIGFKVQAYSYLKVKRELELKSESETVRVAQSLNPDTNLDFYRKLETRDPDFSVNTKEQKLMSEGNYGKTYEYINLKRL